jgi:hypothetical protein
LASPQRAKRRSSSKPRGGRKSARAREDREDSNPLEELAYGAPPSVDDTDEAKADYVVARVAIQDDHYRGLYKQWTKVLLFLVHKQWIRYDEDLASYRSDSDVPPWRQQPVTNWTFAFFRAIRAKLTKNRPSLEVVPPSGDSDDRESAKLGEAVLEFLWRVTKSPQKFMRAVGWFIATGNVFFDVDFDEMDGRVIPNHALVEVSNPDHNGNDPQSRATMNVPCACDDDGEPYRRDDADDRETAIDGGKPYDLDREADGYPEGEVALRVIDPFATRFDPDCDDPNEATEWFESELWPKQKVIDTFGLDDDEDFRLGLGESDSTEMREEFTDRLSRAAAAEPDPIEGAWSSMMRGIDQATGIGHRVLVTKYYRKGSIAEGTPKGRHWIVAGRLKVWPKAPGEEAPLPSNARDTSDDGDDDESPENDDDSAEATDGNDSPDDSQSSQSSQSSQNPQDAPDADAETSKGSSPVAADVYEDGEAPLPYGFWPPRVSAISTPIPGQPQGRGILQEVVPLNEQYNTQDGKILEKHAVDTMGGVWWVMQEDKDITITSEPGQVKVSRGMTKRGREGAPFQATLQPLPAPVYEEREVLQAKMQSIAGLTGVDLSQRPEGVSAGRAFLVLQEASDSSFMPDLTALEEAIEEIGRRELVIVQREYDEDRTIRIRGERGQAEFRSFKGADLVDGLDVRVQTGSMFPWSKSAQFDTKMSLIQALPGLVMNLATGQVDREALAKYLETGNAGLTAFEADEDPDIVEFEREIALFESYDPMQGSNQLPQLGPWMNIPVKQKLCYDFMKRDRSRFDRWSQPGQLAFLDWMQQLAAGVQKLVDAVNPAAPAAPPGNVPPDQGGGAPPVPGGAPGGAPQPGGPPLQLVGPGGDAGKQNTPIANRGTDQMQITAADRSAAGQ